MLSIDFVLQEAASLSFLTYNKNRTMPKRCYVTKCTANKLKNTQKKRTALFVMESVGVGVV